MSDTELLRKRRQIERAREALLRNIGDTGEYDLPWWRTPRDMKWLRASRMRGNEVKAECYHRYEEMWMKVEQIAHPKFLLQNI